MSRLYDRLTEQGTPDPLIKDDLAGMLSNCQVVVADNVAQYAEELGKFRRPFMLDNLPTVAPLFEDFFVEWSVNRAPLRSTGVLFGTWDMDAIGRLDDQEEVNSIWYGLSRQPYKWLGLAIAFDEFLVSGSPIFPVAEWAYSILPGGELGGVNYVPRFGDEGPERRGINTYTRLVPALLAVSFAHCKNVTLTVNDPPEKLTRARLKRGKKPLVRYYTLKIEPMKQVLRTEGGIEHNGLKKALHICRGHFAEYGDSYGKGRLFGKYEGRYWVPSVVKGRPSEGVVVKDYRVTAPTTTQ